MCDVFSLFDRLAVPYGRHVPLSSLTTFRIGGAASSVAFPPTLSGLTALTDALARADFPFRLLGAGSNVLAPDEGLDETVIVTKGLRKAEFCRCYIKAEAGCSLSGLCRNAAERGLSGLEELCGIPGTLGGAVVMNAGAFGRETAQTVAWVRAWDRDTRQVLRLTSDECRFGYRESVFAHKPLTLLSVCLHLSPSDSASVKRRMEDCRARRRATQPSGACAGSFFRRTPDAVPAALLDRCGQKGRRVGDAVISAVHAGFLMNAGAATARDVLALSEAVSATVKEKTGVCLYPEVDIW